MEPEQEKKATKELEEQMKSYKNLQKIGDSQEFNDYFEFCIQAVTDKMIWMFGTHPDPLTKTSTDNIQNWDDFCKARGEIVARLQPIQAVRDSGAIVEHLKKQLDGYYNKRPE